MAEFEIIEAKTERELLDFIKVPYILYKGNPAWAAPLLKKEKEQIIEKKDPFFQYGEAAFFVVYWKNKPIGRISAHISYLHNDRYKDGAGFFGFLEAGQDYHIHQLLYDRASQWLKEKQCTSIRGPFNYTINQTCGMLINNFNDPPYIMMGYNYGYYSKYIERYGFQKIKDLYAWRYKIGNLPPAVNQIMEEKDKIEGLVIRSLERKKMNEELKTIQHIFNESWKENWGFLPITDAEIEFLAREYGKYIDPELITIAEYKEKPVGMAVAFPNFNEILIGTNGKLFPWGYIKSIFKKIRSARLILLGILPEARGKTLGNLSVFLYGEMHRRAYRRGYREGELSWTLEDNDKINRGISLMGAELYKIYRIYEKKL